MAHVASSDSVPSELQQMMNKYRVEDERAQAKELHRTVARQQEARRELNRIRTERSAFTAGWSSYIADLIGLIDQQMSDRETTMDSYDEAEDAWSLRLLEANRLLAQHASQNAAAPVIDLEADEVKMETAEAMVDATVEEEATIRATREAMRSQMAQQHAALQQALQAAKDATDTARERTPRRERKKPGADGEEDGVKPAKASSPALPPGTAHA